MKPETLLKDYALALAQFADAPGVRVDHDVVRAGCIQYFEFNFELAWKAIKAVADQEGLDSGGGRPSPVSKPHLRRCGSMTKRSGSKCWMPEIACPTLTPPKMH